MSKENLTNFLVSINSFGSNNHDIGNLRATNEIKYNSESLTSPLSKEINHL